ncbi:hypothetical protein SAY87_009192 [Trapa incisa]|uniref:Trichome birefringence-like N-terminal domain-containing protein n=1 Tax=Trapa incisa TaxID=236973 RepID=A0AAN7Q256_9MYRT|nr:hypothetical protein SAY87_009192 [Trapa incisa]
MMTMSTPSNSSNLPLATTAMNMMKPYRGKLPLSVATVAVFTVISLVYTERLSPLSASNSTLKIRPCSSARSSPAAPTEHDATPANHTEIIEDRLEFDPKECSVTSGKWVFNRSIKPMYSDSTCPYLDRQVTCTENGRLDSHYQQWEWQPDDCILTRFDPERALMRLRGKRLLFVGDSLQRGQWQSFVCLVDTAIPPGKKSLRRGRTHSVFRALEYNATVEFYWAPFLVESNSDIHVIADPKKRVLKVDSVAKHAKHWTGVDVIVFNTYVWWMSGLRINSLWGSFANGQDGYEELDLPVAYRIALKTWANWVDSNIDPNKTRVFFTTMSPTHLRSVDWGNKDGIKCFNETRPVAKKGHWGTGSNKEVMNVVSSVVSRMKVPVTLLNITQLSEYRIDAHTSIYTETGGQLLTEGQKADPLHHADCIHWCLPGVPDTWNQILYAHL